MNLAECSGEVATLFQAIDNRRLPVGDGRMQPGSGCSVWCGACQQRRTVRAALRRADETTREAQAVRRQLVEVRSPDSAIAVAAEILGGMVV